MAPGIRSAVRLIVFVAGGLVAIIVGAFMIRGTMHMWDRPDDNNKGTPDAGDGAGNRQGPADGTDTRKTAGGPQKKDTKNND